MTKEKDRRFRFLDYVPPIVAFIAAIAALVGSPKWDKAAPGFSKITSFGWIVLAIRRRPASEQHDDLGHNFPK